MGKIVQDFNHELVGVETHGRASLRDVCGMIIFYLSV